MEAGLPPQRQRFWNLLYKWASCGGQSRRPADTQREVARTPALPLLQARPRVTWGPSVSHHLAFGCGQQSHGPQPQAKLTPQAGGGHLSSSRAPAKALQQPCLLAGRPHTGRAGREGWSEQGNGGVLGPRGRPCRPALLGSRGHPGSTARAPDRHALWAVAGSHSGIQPRPGHGADTVLLSKGRATSCLSFSSSARLVTLKRASPGASRHEYRLSPLQEAETGNPGQEEAGLQAQPPRSQHTHHQLSRLLPRYPPPSATTTTTTTLHIGPSSLSPLSKLLLTHRSPGHGAPPP